MSHIVKTTAEIKSREQLERALSSLGWTVNEHATPRYYYTGTGVYGHESEVCDYVVELPGKYDLGIKQNPDGTWKFVCDSELLRGNYGRSSQGRAIVGEEAVNLTQALGEVEVEMMLESKGISYNKIIVNGQTEYEIDTESQQVRDQVALSA
jgi:phage tail tube protein FII